MGESKEGPSNHPEAPRVQQQQQQGTAHMRPAPAPAASPQTHTRAHMEHYASAPPKIQGVDQAQVNTPASFPQLPGHKAPMAKHAFDKSELEEEINRQDSNRIMSANEVNQVVRVYIL